MGGTDEQTDRGYCLLEECADEGYRHQTVGMRMKSMIYYVKR